MEYDTHYVSTNHTIQTPDNDEITVGVYEDSVDINIRNDGKSDGRLSVSRHDFKAIARIVDSLDQYKDLIKSYSAKG